jgi:hypothetical protein
MSEDFDEDFNTQGNLRDYSNQQEGNKVNISLLQDGYRHRRYTSRG